MTLRNQPMALSLYRQVNVCQGEERVGAFWAFELTLLTNLLPVTQFCKHQELDTLKDLYNQDDNHQELGSFHIRASYAAEEV